MTQISPLPLPTSMDPTSYACASFLARYRGDTFRAYSQDMTAFLRWCADRLWSRGTGRTRRRGRPA